MCNAILPLPFLIKPSMKAAREIMNDDSLEFIAPSYGTDGSAGIDLVTQYDIEFDSTRLGSIVIDLCFQAAIPEGHAGLIMPRSGLGSKDGIHPRNIVGVIDADYRGNWLVTAIRDAHGELSALTPSGKVALGTGEGRSFPRGSALFQCVIVPYTKTEIQVMGEDFVWEKTTRDGGYGHTGISRA